MSRIADLLLDIIMPNRCPCCGRFILWNEKLCQDCVESLPPCTGREALPAGCSASVSAFAFDGPAKQGIYSLKEGQGRAFAEYSAGLLAQRLSGSGAQLITCVPMARRKKSARGWDQAEVIARELGRAMNVPCDFSILKRRCSRTEQHGLGAAERAEFAAEQYSAAKDHSEIKGKHIILVDDVITTGSTISVCAGLLLSLGAAEVIAASICRTESKRKRAKE